MAETPFEPVVDPQPGGPPPDVDEPTAVRGVQTPGADFSLVDAFKQDLRELEDAEEVYIPVVGYERTGLQIKYRLPESGKELAQIGDRIRREHKGMYDRNLYAAIDTMIHLCEGIYVQPPGVDKPVMLDPKETGVAVGFDETLAELIGMNGQPADRTARSVVKKLFGGNGHEMAVLSHAEKLNRWVQNTKADLTNEIWQNEGEI